MISWAAKEGKAGHVRALLEAGALPLGNKTDGWTVWKYMIVAKDAPDAALAAVAKVLIAGGANPDLLGGKVGGERRGGAAAEARAKGFPLFADVLGAGAQAVTEEKKQEEEELLYRVTSNIGDGGHNVRDGPGLGRSQAGRLSTGDHIQVKEKRGDWLRIVHNGREDRWTLQRSGSTRYLVQVLAA